jgi:hypothetical protein
MLDPPVMGRISLPVPDDKMLELVMLFFKVVNPWRWVPMFVTCFQFAKDIKNKET